MLALFCSLVLQEASAQLSISGHVRTRSEYRNGQGTPQVADTVPAFFTSQRTRLNIGYSGYRFRIFTALQDVRVWGQDASMINRNTTDAFDGFMMHEAWGEISLVDTGKVIKNFSLKIGRQELVYDDVRLLGNLDWLQQARRHDAVVLKFEHHGFTAHLGAAYNQNAERKSNHIYNGVPVGYAASTNGMGAMYKSMQFLYLAKKLPFGTGSALLFKDDFSKFTTGENGATVFESGAWSRFTLGGNLVGTVKKIAFTASAFYQGGKYREGTSLGEYLISASALYAATPKFSAGPGIDITSGNNGSDPDKKFQRFDPLYGTPHKFWGYMDYFYVADGFGPHGLVNCYIKSKYKPTEKWWVSLDLHRFMLPDAIPAEGGGTMDKNLGTEIDLLLNYSLTKVVNIEGGFSTMFSTSTLRSARVKNVSRADDISSWAYLMVSIKPGFTPNK